MSEQLTEHSSNASCAKRRKAQLSAVLIIWLVGALAGARYYRNHEYDSFAKCLANHEAKMYGLYWCPHCADQKAMFGAAFRYVLYEECAIKDKPSEMARSCQAVGVTQFPSWQFGTDPPQEGVLSLQELSDKTGCALR